MILESAQIQPGQTGHEAAWLLLERMYVRYMGRPMPEVLRTQRGKPYFADGSCQFSLTHTKKHVFCVLSDRPVGVDAEETDREIRLDLAEKMLSAKEKAQYDAAAEKRQALLKFWVLKEAAVKCTGEGLRGYPEKGDFRLDDPRLTETDGCFVAVVEEDTYVV